MAPLTIGTAAMTATRTYSKSSCGPPGTNSALLNTAWMSSGLTMPIVEVSTMSPITRVTCPRYGRNSGITRRAVSRPACAGASPSAAAPGLASGPLVVIRPLSHRSEHAVGLGSAVSGDDPGPGIELDALAAVVLGQRHAQPPERAGGGVGIQAVECFAGAREAADPVQGGGHVRAEVHGLADVGEGDAGEPGRLQDRGHVRRIGQ